MTKIIGIENTERINAELEQLMEEVKKRTKTTITGVKIPELTEINTIDGTEMLIIEGKNGTQRTLVNNIPITEVIDARNDGTTQHANLKDRLDEMTQNVNENIANIGDITNAFNLLNKEVIDAREDNQVPSVTYPSLKERLDAMDAGASATIANQALTLATTVNKEVEQARGGQPTLGDRLDGIDAEINDVDKRVVKNEESITNIQQDFNVLNQEVIDARTDNKTPNETHNSLKERLDSDYDYLNSEIEKTNTQLLEVINRICFINDTMPISQINDLLSQNYGTYIFKSGNYGVTSAEGIVVNSNSHLIFEQGATIIQTTLNATHYDMVLLKDVENVVIDNLQIRGERPNHIGADGEWGHGLTIYSSKNVTINNPTITETWGDGIYIGLKYWDTYKYDNSNILINHPAICDCSRNGISVCSSKKVEIVSPYLKGINRTAPKSGIDIEPEHDTPSGVFLGEVKVTGVMTCIDCTHAFVLHAWKLHNSVVNIQVQDINIRNCFQGVHINGGDTNLKGLININHITCDQISYNALLVKNKPDSLKLSVGTIEVRQRRHQDTSDNGEYGACVWINSTDDCAYQNLGDIYVESFRLDDIDNYDTALRVDGRYNQSDITFDKIYIPLYNSYKNPIKIYTAQDIKIHNLYPARDVIYGTPNVWYSTTYCKHMIYSPNMRLDQNFTLAIRNDLPDGEYKVTFLSDNAGIYSLQINPENGLTGVGYHNVQMSARGSNVTFLKQNDKLYIIDGSNVTIN